MIIDVAWLVRGVTEVDLSDEDLTEAIEGGVDPDDGEALFEWLDMKYDGDVKGDLVSDYYERDRPELIQADFYPPNWAVELSEAKED